MSSPTLSNMHDLGMIDSYGNKESQSAQYDSPGPIRVHAAELEDDERMFPTGFKEHIVLVAWLIVLLPSREGNSTDFEWTYAHAHGLSHGTKVRHLQADKVLKGLQSNIHEAATIVLNGLALDELSDAQDSTNHTKLILSTGSLSQTSEETDNEGTLHLELEQTNGALQIRPIWRSARMLPFDALRYMRNLKEVTCKIATRPNVSIEDLLEVSDFDLETMWSWNHELPPTYDFCMHDMVSQRAKRSPSRVAISSWDGELTYDEVDSHSDSVAHKLLQSRVEAQEIVPVCFEKSRWTVVAVLGVMKAGATFAMMDPSLPLARLQNMAVQVGAKNMVSSRQQQQFASSILLEGKMHVIDEDAVQSFALSNGCSSLPGVPASTLMYIIFTSGSTGTPKGVKISHQTYTSSAIPRAKAVGYTEDSRVLDFASYAFDVSIDSMLLTLGNGGCLCIPSDEERMNDINSAIRRMRINYAGLTPSVARILDADVISSMSALGLGGEAVSARDVTLWGQSTRIIIGYGPCECTIGCTVNSSAATGRNYISIGPGNGAAIWIVDPNDHDRLMPVGAVGELLVEGPIVGQGYLNDPEKTKEAFIEDPKWLLVGHKTFAGRRGRLYKTGDLGKYDPDGSGGIVFAGRKDTQVKLRGQRVELGEIESLLRTRLPPDVNVIAEVIVPQGTGSQPTLVAFAAYRTNKSGANVELSLAQHQPLLNNSLEEANAELAKVVPRYMVPNAYIPINTIPVLISGKTDRKRLKQFGSSLDLRQLDQKMSSCSVRELNNAERRMREAWSASLGLDQDSVQLETNFFVAGGSSLAAMKLASACKAHGLDLTVAEIFTNPTLSAMAAIARACSSQRLATSRPFSMVSRTVDAARADAANACGAQPERIQDIYPCTATQESLFTFSLKSIKAYVAQRVARIPDLVTIDDWKAAWEVAVASTPILRSRVAQLEEPGLQQIVLADNVEWRDATDLGQYLECDRNERIELGQPLARYAIVITPTERYMVWTIHHVLYDGWSEPIVLRKVSDALRGLPVKPLANMKDFVEYVHELDSKKIEDFWRNDLEGAVGPQFPRLPYRDYLPTADGFLERSIEIKGLSASPFTAPTVIRAAWALVASQYTRTDDVVFGETFSGRDTPLPHGGVESIIGPLIATVPVRLKFDRSSSVKDFLSSVQEAVFNRMPYQHMGWQNIRKVSSDAQYASEAPTGLVFQPEPEYVGSDLGFQSSDVVREALHFNPYPLMLACGLRRNGFRACASFDSRVVDMAQMERVLAQLETTCTRLLDDLNRLVQDIDCMPAAELDRIWGWNETAPLALDTTLGRLRAGPTLRHGSKYPRAMNTWVCDPSNPLLLSPIGCVGELCLEGAFLPGETIYSPPWLVDGSSYCIGRQGKVQRTGDLVLLQPDGSMKFVQQKEMLQPVQGHVVDIPELESHCRKYLPSETPFAATVIRPADDSSPAQRLVIFIERPAPIVEDVQVLPQDHDFKSSDYSITICASVSVSLAATLKRLNKNMQETLPSYMTPFAYVVVDKLPSKDESLDRDTLGRLGSSVLLNLLVKLREAYKRIWSTNFGHNTLTASEDILRTSWSTLLGIRPEQIDVDDNFFRLGGDSVLAMRLVSTLRSQGHALSVADIFQNMRLGDAARVMKLGQGTTQASVTYTPFSSIGVADMDKFISKVIRPKLANPDWSVQDVCSATDTQVLDVNATISAPSTSLQYTMLYFDQPLDRERLYRACNDLVKAHEILRTVFVQDESRFLQVVLNDLALPITMHNSDKNIELFVKDICMQDAEFEIVLGTPFTKIFHVESTSQGECIVLRLSHAQYDAVSLPRMLEDLETLYRGEQLSKILPFTHYVGHTKEAFNLAKAVNYWQHLLQDSKLSVLPDTSGQPGDQAVFRSTSVELSLVFEEITIATLLTATWSIILARRLQTCDVTFGSITSGRNVDIAGADEVVGPCYQFTPVRVTFDSRWTAIDLLRYVQKQAAESSGYDFLGCDKIAKDCTQWPAHASFFDSIVHHQIAAEDFDTMRFGDQSARVDVFKPHGDAALPLKVVTFVKNGKTHVGVVGSERDEAFVEDVLGEVASTIQELASGKIEKVLKW